MPGQGRATVDTHHDLPHITATQAELEQDLAPFRALNWAAMGMTGHVVYDVWDDQHTATMSPFVIDAIIRQRVGFDGLLMSDDLDMNALQGDVATRALRCVEAGCDLALNCWGRFDEMVAIAAMLPEITDAARARLDRAMTMTPVAFNPDRLAHLLDKRDQLLALADASTKLTGGATGAA
jgi:beta-N-acetylhexosaminidase